METVCCGYHRVILSLRKLRVSPVFRPLHRWPSHWDHKSSVLRTGDLEHLGTGAKTSLDIMFVEARTSYVGASVCLWRQRRRSVPPLWPLAGHTCCLKAEDRVGSCGNSMIIGLRLKILRPIGSPKWITGNENWVVMLLLLSCYSIVNSIGILLLLWERTAAFI